MCERLIGTHPIRLEYLAAPLTVWPTVGAHEFIVATAPHEYDRLSVSDVGRSLRRVVLDATRMGVVTCWIGPGADPSSIAAHLDGRFDPSAEHMICVCAVGWASGVRPEAGCEALGIAGHLQVLSPEARGVRGARSAAGGTAEDGPSPLRTTATEATQETTWPCRLPDGRRGGAVEFHRRRRPTTGQVRRRLPAAAGTRSIKRCFR